MNVAVGEQKVRLAGTEYVLRPSFQAFIEIERYSKSSIMRILERFRKGKPKFRDIVSVIFACFKEANPKAKVSFDQVAEWVFEAGTNAVHAQAFLLIASLYSGIEKKTAVKATEKSEK